MVGRNILALVVGIFAAGAVIFLVELAGHRMASDDMLFAIVIVGYGFGALAGSAVAARIGPSRWPSTGVCVALAALAIANLMTIEHPIWFIPGAALALLIGLLVGRRLGGRNKVTSA